MDITEFKKKLLEHPDFSKGVFLYDVQWTSHYVLSKEHALKCFMSITIDKIGLVEKPQFWTYSHYLS